jgi:hypothetical protein
MKQDITSTLIAIIDFTSTDVQYLEEPYAGNFIIGTAIITDTRTFKHSFDEEFPTVTSGDISIDIDVELLNADGDNVEFSYDIRDIERQLICY